MIRIRLADGLTRAGIAAALGLAFLYAAAPMAAETKAQHRARGVAKKSAGTAQVATASHILLTTSALEVDSALKQAFDSLNSRDLTGADAGYTRVLAAEPQNVDALHGRAAIALRREQFDRAADYYRRALEVDPRDAVAQAGLAGLRGPAYPTDTETRLQLLLASQPDRPMLHFALGNLYAAAGRWQQARQAFLAAHSGDPTQPDYLFNLAVSHDHLRESERAAHFYRQALSAADKRLPAFDKAQATARLSELQ